MSLRPGQVSRSASCSLSLELWHALHRQAVLEGVSRGEVMKRALAQYLEKLARGRGRPPSAPTAGRNVTGGAKSL